MIRIPRGPDDQVKSISVVLHMKNGRDVVFGEEDEVGVVMEEPEGTNPR